MVRTRGSTAAAKGSPESSRSYSPSSSEQESRSESEGGAPSSSSDSGVAVNTFVLRKRRVAVKKVTMSTYDQKKGEQGAGSSRPAAEDSPRRKFRRFRTGKQPVTEAVQGDEAAQREKFKQRFSVHRILEFKFNGAQVNWIHEAGHGNLLKMSEFSVPVKLVKWIMRNIDPMLREFRFGNKVIVFDRALVCNILGFENGTEQLQLSSDPATFEEFQRLRDMYRDGKRVPMSRCIELMDSDNRETFLRSFMLLALGTVYCPGTGNSPTLKYLHNLHDVSKIKEFDWAGHIIDVLMHSVEHYQNLSREQLQKDHHIAGCLAIFVIAYMDHLDLPQNRGTHQVCYDLPRICNVSNEDFEFVMRVDMDRQHLDSFGRIPFRAATPYSSPPSTTEAPSAGAPHVAAADDVQTSFADWLHPLGSAGPSEVPSFYEPYIKEMNEHLEHDIEELSKSLAIEYKLKCKAICQKRVAEMIAKISKASSSGAMPPGSSPGQGEASAGDAGVEIGAQGGASAGDDAEVEIGAQGEASGGDDAEVAAHISSIVFDAVKEGARLDASTANPPLPRSESILNTRDDIPSFDLFHEGDAEFDFMKSQPDDTVATETKTVRQPATTTAPHPGAAHEVDVGASKMSSSSFEKKNRRKRAALDLNPGKKPKRIKLEDDAKLAYETYVLKKLEMKRRPIGASAEKPPFIQIAGFHVSYEDFYESLKPRGWISNTIMTMWTYQFNQSCKDACERDKNLVRKFAFSAMNTALLIVDPTNFHQDSISSTLLRLEKTWSLSSMHVFFFPIVHEDHWVLVCINMFLHKVFFFNSMGGSRDNPYLKCAQNLVQNFAINAFASGILKRDVAKFEWEYPKDYPMQKTLNDCGLCVALYMEFWDGKRMDIKFEQKEMAAYRKKFAASLLLCDGNEISAEDFVKEHCVVLG